MKFIDAFELQFNKQQKRKDKFLQMYGMYNKTFFCLFCRYNQTTWTFAWNLSPAYVYAIYAFKYNR